MTWKTSSHSIDGACVEVAGPWETSSHSNAEGNCVEVAVGGVVGVRDTKARELGHFTVGAPAWTAFLEGITT